MDGLDKVAAEPIPKIGNIGILLQSIFAMASAKVAAAGIIAGSPK